MTTTHVDWKKIKALYRAGLVSVSEIAREAGINESAIRKRAQKGNWKRDLTAKVRAKTGEKLTLALANGGEGANNHARTDEETIELAALTQVAVVRSHIKSVRRGQEITMRLLDELDATTTYNGELADMIGGEDDAKKSHAMARAISLPGRAAIMRDLAQAARIWTGLERQAFGISDERKAEESEVATTASDLLAEIQADAAAMGLRLLAGPEGVANRPAPEERD